MQINICLFDNVASCSVYPFAGYFIPPGLSLTSPFSSLFHALSLHGQNITHPYKYDKTTQQVVPEPICVIHTLRSQALPLGKKLSTIIETFRYISDGHYGQTEQEGGEKANIFYSKNR